MNNCFCERLKPYGIRCRNCHRRDNDPPPLTPPLLRNPGSEAIITEDDGAATRFLDEVDAAAVYVNASTQFTDGGQFGLGAEVGISTQKFHARGPMGLKELTSYKWVIIGNGQVRP